VTSLTGKVWPRIGGFGGWGNPGPLATGLASVANQ
jgi:hypothetical protein